MGRGGAEAASPWRRQEAGTAFAQGHVHTLPKASEDSCLGSTPKSQDGTNVTPEQVFTNSKQLTNLASLPLVSRIVFSKPFFCALYFRIVFIALTF